MKTLYYQFLVENKDKSFNEILGNAKSNLNNTWLILDVDDYNNNEIKCQIGYHSNNNPNNNFIQIEVEFIGGKIYFLPISNKVTMYGREWDICAEFVPEEDVDWKVIKIDCWTLWMNNRDGVMHLVSENTILGCIF
jgi:hypothetical protein